MKPPAAMLLIVVIVCLPTWAPMPLHNVAAAAATPPPPPAAASPLTPNTSSPPVSESAATHATTSCSITLHPPTLAITCSGPGPVSIAPTASIIKSASFHGAALNPNDPTCTPLPGPHTPGTPPAALVTLCSTASDLLIANASILNAEVPNSRPAPIMNITTATATVPSAAALAILTRGPSSLRVARLNATGIRGGSALLLQAASTGSSVTVASCTFTNNSAGRHSGGGLTLHLAAGTSALLQGNTFQNNSAAAAGGALAHLWPAKTLLPAAAATTRSNATGRGAALAPAAAIGGTTISLEGGNTFHGCKAASGNGGGLLVVAAGARFVTVAISRGASFVDNVAQQGGGGVLVDAEGSSGVTVRVGGASLFRGNSAGLGGTGYFGGGAMAVSLWGCVQCKVEVAGRSRFVSNFVPPPPIVVKDNSVGCGGALQVALVESASCSVVLGGDAQFVNNSAWSGGGAVDVRFVNATDGMAAIQGQPLFDSNAAQGSGGGLYIWMISSNRSNISLTGASRWRRNVVPAAGMYGGAFALDVNTSDVQVAMLGPLRFEGNRVLDPGATPDSCISLGGAIAISTLVDVDMTLSLSGVVFENNEACNGAGLSIGYQVREGSQVFPDRPLLRIEADHLQFRNNSAGAKGGGMYIDSTQSVGGMHLNLTDVHWEGNNAAAGGGGLVLFANESNVALVTMRRVAFVRNTVTQVGGGGLLMGLGPPALYDTTVYDGPLLQPTSLALLNDILVSIADSVFQGNVVTDAGVGGALYLEGSSLAAISSVQYLYGQLQRLTNPAPEDMGFSLLASNVTFVNNSAATGGGLYVRQSQAKLRAGCLLAGNSASDSGGGAFVRAGLWVLETCSVRGNRAGSNGGGLCGVLADDSTPTIMTVNDSAIVANSASQQGGGLYLKAGSTTLDNTTVSSNNAGQQGGGVAFDNTCSKLSTACFVDLLNGTLLTSNSAVSGGGLFLTALPHNDTVISRLSAAIAPNTNTAMYASTLSIPPPVPSVTVEPPYNFTVPSSTGINGLVPLVANVGQASVQVSVRFCGINIGQPATNNSAYLLGLTEVSRAGGNTTFEALRVITPAVNQTYCLQVLTPDYPAVTPVTVWVTIRDCIPGEVRDNNGCSQCRANQYSFHPTDKQCSLCHANAVCDGGAFFIPRKGFWHSAPDSSNVQPCPNRKACQGDRHLLQACQDGRNCSRTGSATSTWYGTLQCTTGYQGNLCGSCRKDQGYGQGAFLRCAKCLSRVRTAVLLLVLAGAACALVVWVSIKSMAEAQQQQQQLQGQPGSLQPQASGSTTSVASSSQDTETLRKPNSSPLHDGSNADAGPGESKAGASNDIVQMELSDVFKVLVVHIQYLSIIGNLLVDWPWVLRGLMDTVQLLFVTSSSRIVSWDCLGSLGNGAELAIRLLVPLGLVALACAIVWLLHRRRTSRTPAGALRPLPPPPPLPSSPVTLAPAPAAGPPPGTGSNNAAASSTSAVDCIVTTATIGLFLFYSVLSSTSLTAFSCIPVDGRSYWVKDMTVRCWRGRHLRASLAIGILGTFVFCILVPGTTIWWLARNRGRVGQPAFQRRYGFLYRLYRPKYCFWEGVVCLQTTALVAVDLFGQSQGAFYQLVLLILVLALNSTLVSILHPFRCRSLQLLHTTSTVTLLLTCLGVQSLLKGYALRTTLDLVGGAQTSIMVLLLMLNLGFIALCVYLVGRAAVRMAKSLLDKATSSMWLRQYGSNISERFSLSISKLQFTDSIMLHRSNRSTRESGQQPGSTRSRSFAWPHLRPSKGKSGAAAGSRPTEAASAVDGSERA